MILCLCRGIPEDAVGSVIAEGASSLDEIVTACAAGSDCGACHEYILDMLAGRAGVGGCPAMADAAAG